MIDIDDPPKNVKNWIKRVKRCFTEAPFNVWFYASDNNLYIMALGKEGEHVMTDDGAVDPEYIIDEIVNSDIDGGGW